MKQLIYGIRFICNNKIRGKPTPLICGLTITNSCNLHCQHCRIPQRGSRHMSFQQVKSCIDDFYSKGGRTLYIQGGEPFLWKDDAHALEDIVQYSHNRGFYTTVIYTNGTFPLNTTAKTIFVSVDGLPGTHDQLRGKTFEKIMHNIQNASHPSIYINYTINQQNKGEIEAFCKYIQNIKQIKGVFFYIHTPYYGKDELYIDLTEKQKVIKDLLNLEQKYKILNSSAGLKSALRNDWKRPLNICYVYEEGQVFFCCRYPNNPELCENCGYLSYAEIDQVLKLKPSAIRKALKYF